jgi:hypothetical protein
VSAATSHWGWKVSDSELASPFVLLPSGYACEEKCASISPCGGHRTDILCGACVSNYSIAFFSTECVPSVQCSSWKWVPLIFMCIAYQVLFSAWIFWSSETEILERQQSNRSLAKKALERVELFQNLSSEEIDVVVLKMELIHVSAQSTILVQGHPASFMYIIERGILNVYTFDASGGETLINSLAAPKVAGELALINGTNCGASVRAATDADLWRLDKSCLENISEEDQASFSRNMRDQYTKAPSKLKSSAVKTVDDASGDAFLVLMWFYQLAGIILSTSSPLKYVEGSAAAYSIVSFLVNSRPSSDAASEVSTSAASSDSSAYVAGAFKFCVSSSFTMSQVYAATFIYYVLWALLFAILARRRVWKLVRSVIIHLSLGFNRLCDIVPGNHMSRNSKDSSVLREKMVHRQSIDIEIRGPVMLKWFVTCFSAVVSLLMKGTACFRLNGYVNAADDRRWIYDGRVACFSDSGDLPGRWQVASAFGVAVVLIAPVFLWRMMVRIHRLEKHLRSAFQVTLMEAYSGPHSPRACHWMIVM